MFLILYCSLSQILLFTVRNNCTVCKYIMLSCYNPVKYFSRCSLFHPIFRITSLFTGFCTLYTKYWLSRVFCLNKNKKKVELFFKNSSFFLFYMMVGSKAPNSDAYGLFLSSAFSKRTLQFVSVRCAFQITHGIIQCHFTDRCQCFFGKECLMRCHHNIREG